MKTFIPVQKPANLLFILLMLLISSCSSTAVPTVPTQGPTAVANLTPTSNLDYPAPITTQPENANAYPMPGGQTRITPFPTGQIPTAPSDAPQPDNGKASISGTIFSFTTSMVVPKTFYYLTPGWGPQKIDPPPALVGPNEKNGDISAYTDETGQIFLNNIPPGNYYLAVSAPYSWSVAEISPTDNKPKLITLAANQKYPLGVIYVSWP